MRKWALGYGLIYGASLILSHGNGKTEVGG